jgi:hypothetical protein
MQCCFALTLLSATGSVQAFKLDPCLRVLTYDQGRLSQSAISDWNRCDELPEQFTLAVHEHITLASVQEYRDKATLPFPKPPPTVAVRPWKFNYMTQKPWQVNDKAPKHSTEALMFGTWWNDEPLMLLWGQKEDFQQGLRYIAPVFMFKNWTVYQGATEDPCPLKAEDHLMRASHFGAMQYLHFMSNEPNCIKSDDRSTCKDAGTRLQPTLDRAMDWIKFAYPIAARLREPESAFTHEEEVALGMPPIHKNLCLNDRTSAKVLTVFSRMGPDRDRAYRRLITPDVALGTILHIVQDSFSPGHACRVRQEVDGLPMAILADVYNYNEQTSSSHAKLDVFPDWLLKYASDGSREHRIYANDPIAIGVWLLQAVDRQAPWSEVNAYLRSVAFPVIPASERKDALGRCIGRS